MPNNSLVSTLLTSHGALTLNLLSSPVCDSIALHFRYSVEQDSQILGGPDPGLDINTAVGRGTQVHRTKQASFGANLGADRTSTVGVKAPQGEKNCRKQRKFEYFSGLPDTKLGAWASQLGTN